MQRVPSFPIWSRSYLGYLAATALFLAALSLRFALAPVASGLPYVTFYPAIIIGFYVFGAGPGVWASLLSALAAAYFFMPPYGAFSTQAGDYVALGLFVATNWVIGAIVCRMHTDRRRLGAALERMQAQESGYRSLFELANDGIFIHDANGFIDCNERGAQMYGCTREQVIGHSPGEFAPERQPDGRLSAEVAAERIAAALAGQPQHFEWQPTRLDGTPFDVEITLSRMVLGKSVCLQAIVRDITQRRKAQQELLRLAQIDMLTGLANRRHFMELAERELSRAIRYGGPLSLLMIDIDQFKRINDRYGHQTGDAVLQKFGALCREMLRDIDTVGRIGGEEFAVLLPKTGMAHAVEVAERLRQKVEAAEVALEHVALGFTLSIGVSSLAEGASIDVDALLNQADQAMYEGKRAGRNCVRVFGEDVAARGA